MGLPKRLKNDAIITAAFEARFESDEVEELIVGRIADWVQAEFASYKIENKRTGAADIPLALRKSNPQLRNQSTLDVTVKLDDHASRLIRIGNSVFGYILKGTYCGWDVFRLEIKKAVAALLKAVSINKVERLGLRYTNALNAKDHFVSGFKDLNLELKIGDQLISDSAQINFLKTVAENHTVLSRVLTPNFWNEVVPEHATVIADFDVATITELKSVTRPLIGTWIDQAHRYEKEAFFATLPSEVIDKLRES